MMDMLKQTIGVEVEMNNITREKAAKVVAEVLGTTDVKYAGGCYYKWVVTANDGRKWQLERDSSIHGPNDERCELVTPILTYDDMNTLQDIIRALRHAGAKSDASRGCGVHIHIGGDGHNAKTLRNLTNIMASHEELLIDALDLDEDRISDYCSPVHENFLKQVNKRKPKTMKGLSDVWYISQNCEYGRDQHYNHSRYHMLNLHATFTKGTIEFRLFQFNKPTADKKNGLHAGQLKAYIQLCLALSNKAKEVNYASYKKPAFVDENPKYVMRFWLKSLGMIGDEFKTARELFMERLHGNSDCRTGNREDCTHRNAA